MGLFHYSDKDGYNAIRSQRSWCFEASQPPGDNPYGAYFTDYTQDEPNLAAKLWLPRRKVEYSFQFKDAGDLKRLRGKRGDHILYSEKDYLVVKDRQIEHGPTKYAG